MELSSKEIRDIGIATAQHVLEGLHRYTVDYVPPSSVQQALRDSMVEEKTAQDWYAKRIKYCQSVGDMEVGKALYEIMKDEADHYRIESELLAKRNGGKPDKITLPENKSLIYGGRIKVKSPNSVFTGAEGTIINVTLEPSGTIYTVKLDHRVGDPDRAPMLFGANELQRI